jgi:hypothetical protein
MENNSTGGNDKRSWRDRLGIGTKDLPRIAEEFKAAEPTRIVVAPQPGEAKPAPRAAQVVVRPAPMAPRPAPKADVKIAQPANNDALAERLKSQREAAEKLAEQRVQAARQKAELAANQRIQAKELTKPQFETARPKFTFAEDDVAKNRPTELPALPRRTAARVTASVSPPKSSVTPVTAIAPPRPALGVDRPPMPPRPANVPLDAQATPQSIGFRPLDPSVGYTPPQPVFPQRQYTTPPAPQRTQQPARPPYYAGPGQPQMPDMQAPEVPFADNSNGRPPPRPPLRGPMSGPGGVPPGSYADDVFEQFPQRPQRRLGAGDYQNAYRDSDLGYEYEQPKSSAPWVLLLLLLLAGALAAAGAWFYETQMKGQTLVPTASTQDGVPAVEAPVTPAKSPPEQPATAAIQPDAAGSSVVPATTKKQIYDRIVGDREVLGGQMVPTEEVPVVPDQNSAPAGENQMTPAAEPPPVIDDAAPLPLPPPPGQTGSDQQGALEPAPSGQSGDQIAVTPTNDTAAGANQAADTSLEQVVEPVEGESKDVQGLAKAAQDVASVQEQISQSQNNSVIEPPPPAPPDADTTNAETTVQPPDPMSPAEAETISDEPAPAPSEIKSETPVETAPVPKPEKTKIIRLAQKKKPSPPVRKASGNKPLVLVPSQDGNATAAASGDGNILYGDTQVAAQPQPAKRRTLFDLLGNKKPSPQATAGNDQVASIASPNSRSVLAQPKPVKLSVQPDENVSPVSAGGFVAQLASFRSQEEANSEFARMRNKHGSLIGGMSPLVSKVTVAGSSRYRLAVGPMSNRAAANRLCSQLLAAGERDCIAKQR